MKGNIGHTLINELEAKPRPYDVRDSKLNGFMLRVHPTGRMVYYVEYTRGQKHKLGTTQELKPAEARQLADKTIFNFKNARTASGKRSVMRDKHQRGASFLRAFEQNIDDFFAGGTVKISGWLISQNNLRLVD